jgi:hypothetical protein
VNQCRKHDPKITKLTVYDLLGDRVKVQYLKIENYCWFQFGKPPSKKPIFGKTLVQHKTGKNRDKKRIQLVFVSDEAVK